MPRTCTRLFGSLAILICCASMAQAGEKYFTNNAGTLLTVNLEADGEHLSVEVRPGERRLISFKSIHAKSIVFALNGKKVTRTDEDGINTNTQFFVDESGAVSMSPDNP